MHHDSPTRPADGPRVHIEGPRLRLRDWTNADIERLPGLLDPDRPWHQTNGPYFGAPTEEQTRAQVDRFADLAGTPLAHLPVPRTMLAMEFEGRLIGVATWYWESKETDWRRMGVVIHDEDYWGEGLGTEAMAVWTSYLFETTDALRLDFATYSGNPGMIAIGRTLGFVEEGRFRAARRWSGGVHDSVVMGLLREEWEQVRTGWPAVRA